MPLLLALLLVALLSGCAGIDKGVVERSMQVNTPDSQEPVDDRQPNPYLEDRRRIDASAHRLFESALVSLETGDLTTARQQFLQLSQAQPQLSGPWVNLGIIHYQLGELEQAESSWQKAIALNRDNFDAYTNLGLLKREQGQFDEAEKVYRQALRRWPDNAAIRCNLGILYDLYTGDQVQALQQYLLCEQLNDQPSRQLRGWIIDLERRTQSLVENQW